MVSKKRDGKEGSVASDKLRAAWTLLAAGAATLAAGCSGETFTPGAPSVYTSSSPAADPAVKRPLVGIAISGGGNRAALFASYVFELFGSLPVDAPAGSSTQGQQVSFLDTVDHISSVSGGSFAATYFSMKGIGNYTAMLSSDAVPTPHATFFADFHKQMNFDWESSLSGLKIITFGSNADGLTKAIDKEFLHGATFADLDRREATGASPFLILNATHYDSGRRFVMTTIPSDAFCLNTQQFLLDVVYSKPADEDHVDDMHAARLGKCDRHDALTPEGFDNFWNPDKLSVPSADIPLARAVATSGAFPLVVGPIAYEIAGNDALLHLIDGGVADNSGLESILQLFLRDLIKDKSHRNLVISIDASLPFNSYGSRIADDWSPLSTFINDPTRVTDIQAMRASLYRQNLWNVTSYTARSLKRSNNAVTRLDLVQLKPSDLDIGPLRIDTPDCHQQYDDAQSVHAAARDIPTRYHLAACDAQLTRIAACWSVHRHAAEIQAFFDSAPANPRRSKTGYGTRSRAPGGGTDNSTASESNQATAMLDARIRQLCPELATANAL